MFDFLFKRKARNPSPTKLNESIAPIAPVEAPGHAKRAALTEAGKLQGEDAAVEFILRCQFADARFAALEQVQSPAALERVLKGMRNADRRVAKLVQSRIDVIAHRQRSEQHAQRCIDDASRLLQQKQLMPNQVADLDRQWRAGGDVSTALGETFASIQSALHARLEAQASLQRAVIDTLAALKELIAAASGLEPAEVAAALSALEQQMATHLDSSEANSLPPQLGAEFGERQIAFRQSLAVIALQFQNGQIRRLKLEEWESAEAEALTRDALKREWQALPALQDQAMADPLQARFEALLSRFPDAVKPPPASTKPEEQPRDGGKAFVQALEAMEKALDDGALRLASDHDKAIRALDIKSARLTDAHSARLTRARSELGRLQGWARWGGTVSREELLKAAEGMIGQEIAPAELAKKVGSLRERWKSLDTSAGSASRELWERFDSACTNAYAPAAEHFRKLSEERQQNQVKAREQIIAVAEFAASSHYAEEDSAAPDWKEIAQFSLKSRQAWQRLGTIDRKEKKKLDSEFEQAMQLLLTPLAHQRSMEIARREQLIVDVGNLRPSDRSAPESLRGLQERWQAQSKALPLERRDEQELWQRFRSACDAVFAKRKEAAVSADADRRVHLEEKEALCAMLESVIDADEKSIVKTLREAREAWSKAGPVPQAAEARLDARYKAAAAGLQDKLDGFRNTAAELEATALRCKLGWCRAAEDALLGGTQFDAGHVEKLHHDWQQTPVLPAQFEHALRQRLDAGLLAWQANDRQYAATLEAHRADLLGQILRFEILAGIDSPAALSRERLQMQVEVLQSSLKAGLKPVPQKAQLLALCALTAAVDAPTAVRLDLVIGKMKDVISG